MDLQQIVFSNWFEEHLEEGEVPEDFESNFRSSKKTLRVLRLWVERELSKLDNEMSPRRIADKADRGEYALMVLARREQLLQFRVLLEFKD